jgi:hypothetical protein
VNSRISTKRWPRVWTRKRRQLAEQRKS